METVSQSPLDPAFVQDPYPFYDRARALGRLVHWEDYGMAASFDAATVQALLRDRRLGREAPDHLRRPYPDHLRDWGRVEDCSLLEMEPPGHTQLRGLVLRAFTSRRIAGLRPDIEAIADELLAALPRDRPFDLIPAYCTPLPVRIIARLLGVPEDIWPDLLRWSHAMVAMYQVGRDRATEEAANAAARAFSAFLTDYIEARRADPRDDLLTELIAAEQDGEKLNTDELIGTCILLLNAGHEATVHGLGNAMKALLEHGGAEAALGPDRCAATVEEVLRYDPPLHIFTRYAYEDVTLGNVAIEKDQQVALVLGAAGRDPALCDDPHRFDPARTPRPHAAFGGGLHFCVGAPLARMEMQIALAKLFTHLPALRLADRPRYAKSYHFHKLDRLMVQA